MHSHFYVGEYSVSKISDAPTKVEPPKKSQVAKKPSAQKRKSCEIGESSSASAEDPNIPKVSCKNTLAFLVSVHDKQKL